MKNANDAIVGHLNINSFQSKFIFAKEIIPKVGLFLFSESKLDSTFPNNLFKIKEYRSFRYAVIALGGGGGGGSFIH